MEYRVKIIEKEWLTRNVIQLRLEKPSDFSFIAGQAIEVAVDNPRFYGERAPFTLTCLNTENYLELILKVYPDHNGMTLELSNLNKGEYLIISNAWDSFTDMGAGMFIAGGTGVTPFVALLRQHKATNNLSESKMLFANQKAEDIFLYEEFRQILGKNFVNILSREKTERFLFGHIDSGILESQIDNRKQPFYICGPDNFAEQIRGLLLELSIDKDLINIGY